MAELWVQSRYKPLANGFFHSIYYLFTFQMLYFIKHLVSAIVLVSKEPHRPILMGLTSAIAEAFVSGRAPWFILHWVPRLYFSAQVEISKLLGVSSCLHREEGAACSSAHRHPVVSALFVGKCVFSSLAFLAFKTGTATIFSKYCFVLNVMMASLWLPLSYKRTLE